MFRNTCTLRRAVYCIYQNTKTFERQRSTDFLLRELHPRFSSDQSQFHHKTLNTVLRGSMIDFQKRQIMQTAAGKSGIQSYLKLSNTAVRELSVEEDKGSDYRLVKDASFCYIKPTPLDNPRLISASRSALDVVDIPHDYSTSTEFLEYLSGNRHLPGSEPAAHCYCGYQYDLFSGQLGDGAATYLGSIENSRGEHWELQLKGTGRTPFGRAGADGRKVLRSSIREFLCSEAMHHMGIPTTRAGSLIGSDTKVFRDALWTGKLAAENAAVVLRIAPTFFRAHDITKFGNNIITANEYIHLSMGTQVARGQPQPHSEEDEGKVKPQKEEKRIGSLEVCNSEDPNTGLCGPSKGNVVLLKQLVDYTIKHFYPRIHNSDITSEQKYLKFYDEVLQATGGLVAQWQCVGFCHGVLNTDNISLVGLTMDYGPFNFMEQYDPDHICNGSDFWGRHTYRKQMENCRWCCEMLAEALNPLVPLLKTKERIHIYDATFNNTYMKIMRQKLGLQTAEEGDKVLVEELLDTMQKTGADFTRTFRGLSLLQLPVSPEYEQSKTKLHRHLIHSCCKLDKLKSIYHVKKYPTPKELELSLWVLQMNPQLLPRYEKMAQESMDELNAREIIKHVQNLTEESKKEQDHKLWSRWIEKYAERLSKEVIPGVEAEIQNQNRTKRMNEVNPRFVLRRSILQEAIEMAEKANYHLVNVLLQMGEDPFSDKPGQKDARTEEDRQEMKRVLGMFDRGINSETCRITCSS